MFSSTLNKSSTIVNKLDEILQLILDIYIAMSQKLVSRSDYFTNPDSSPSAFDLCFESLLFAPLCSSLLLELSLARLVCCSWMETSPDPVKGVS